MADKKGTKEKESKYARKQKARRRLAIKLEMPADTPYPVLWAMQEKNEDEQ